MAEELMFPYGRMIGGNIDALKGKTEADGKTPKIGKDGKQEMSCSIGIAIPKGGEKAWWETVWGAKIYQIGAAAHPTMVANPAFSWKITDGDSTIPNQAGKIPCQQVGYPGHWVLWFSQSWLPKRCSADGKVLLPEGSIVPGFYVQVYGSIAGNKLVAGGKAGVYLNPLAVALVGEGDRISTDVDTSNVGFGGAPLPQGARPVTPAAPQFAGAPGMPPVPGAPAAPPVPPAAPAPVAAGPIMLPAAQGQTYAAMIAAGWNDTTLVQHGMMQAPVAAAPAMPAAPPVPPGPPAGAPPVPGSVVPPAAPSQTFLTPGAPPVPPAAPAPPAPPAAGPVMLPAAQGVTYEAFKAQNWTDEQLRAQGMMQ